MSLAGIGAGVSMTCTFAIGCDCAGYVAGGHRGGREHDTHPGDAAHAEQPAGCWGVRRDRDQLRPLRQRLQVTTRVPKAL
eukprot:3795991-Pyramimonas_sp.AAC.1